MFWIHEDAQGLVLGCWGLGLPWSLFMEGEVGRFFGNCYLGNWGCHGVCSWKGGFLEVASSKFELFLEVFLGFGIGWVISPRHMNTERANPNPFLLWILSTFDFSIVIANSIFWPCDIEFVILPLWQIKGIFFLYVLPWSFVAFEKYFHTLKQKMKNCKRKEIMENWIN